MISDSNDSISNQIFYFVQICNYDLYIKRFICFPSVVLVHQVKEKVNNEMNIIAFYVFSTIIVIILVLFCLMVAYYEEIGQRQILDDQEKHTSKYVISKK